MSELDSERRELLAGLLRSSGQAIVTTTETEHVPGVGSEEVVRVSAGSVLGAVPA
jgi:recombinational DNA repair ATPase RecF